MLLMIMLCLSFFRLSYDASPTVGSMVMLNYSTSRLVKSFEVSKAPYSSTHTRLHGCCLLFNVVIMNWMMQTGDRLDEVGNIHIILFFSKTTVIM